MAIQFLHISRMRLHRTMRLLMWLAVMALITGVGCSGAGLAENGDGTTNPEGKKGYSCSIQFDKGNAPQLMVSNVPPTDLLADPGDIVKLPGRGSLPLDIPANSTQAGNYFIGWSTKNIAGSEKESFLEAADRVVGTASETFEVEGNTTLYAVYVASMNIAGSKEQVGTLKLDFNLRDDNAHPVLAGWPTDCDGSSFGSRYRENFASGRKIAPYGDGPILRHGYKFAGWSENKDASPAQAHPAGKRFAVTKWDTEAQGFVVYAIWERYATKDLATIKYNWNYPGSSLSYTIPDFGSGQPVTMPDAATLNKMQGGDWSLPAGKGIIGWANISDATNPDFRAGETIYPSQNMELFAVWTGKSRFVNYNDNVMNSVETLRQVQSYMLSPLPNDNVHYSIGQSIKLAASLKVVRGNWKGDFLGWTTIPAKPAQGWPEGEPFAGNSTIKMPDGEGAFTLYAQWKEKPFGIIYYDENTPPNTCYVGSAPLWKYGYIGDKVVLDTQGDLKIKDRDDLLFAGWGETPTSTAADAIAPGTEYGFKVAWNGEDSSKNYLYAVWVAKNVPEEPKVDLAITSFSLNTNPIAKGNINEDNHTISVVVPNGKDITNLVATFAFTGASVNIAGAEQTSGETANDYSYDKIYTVTGKDNSTQDYTVTVTNPSWTKINCEESTRLNFRVEDMKLIGSTLFGIAGGRLFTSANYGAQWTTYDLAQYDPSGDNELSGFSCIDAANNTIIIGTLRYGAFISTDGAATWHQPAEKILKTAWINDVKIVGSTWYIGTSNYGLYISINNGASWNNIKSETSNGLISNHIAAIAIDGSTIGLATLKGLCISRNNGSSWTTYTMAQGLSSDNCSDIAISGSTYFVALDNGSAVSRDDGANWTTFNEVKGYLPTYIHTAAAFSGAVMCLGTLSEGLFISFDNGENWISAKNELGLNFDCILHIFIADSKIYVVANEGLAYYQFE